MIVAEVTYDGIRRMAPAEMQAFICDDSIPRFRDFPGLVRKYYMASEAGTSARGVYLWESRGAAEAAFTDEWADHMERLLGARPQIRYWRCAAVLDNRHGEVLTGQPAGT